MIVAGSGLVVGRPPEAAALQAARGAMESSGLDRAEVALVFVTADAYRQGHEVLEAVRRLTGAESIVGCSGAGVLTERGEVEEGPAMAVMVLRTGGSPPIRPFLVADREMLDSDAGDEISRRTGLTGAPDGCLAILPDAANLRPDDLLLGLSARLDPVAVVGGVAGGMPLFELYGTEVAHGALPGLAVPVQPLVGIGQGCQPIGEPYIVTDAVANTIHSIAGRRPVEILRETIETVPDYERRVPAAGVFAGLAVDPMKSPLERGDFVIRSLVGLDQESGTITLAEPVFAGQTIQFQLRDAQAAHEDLDRTLSRLERALAGRRPAFGLYFNCAGRGRGLYGAPGHDVALIRERMGEWPLIGFFGNGEFAPIGQENFFHTHTGVLAVFPQP